MAPALTDYRSIFVNGLKIGRAGFSHQDNVVLLLMINRLYLQ